MKLRVVEHTDYRGEKWWTVERKFLWMWDDICPLATAYATKEDSELYMKFVANGEIEDEKIVSEIST